MLFKLSMNNIRKGVKDYAIYFVTLVLGIAIFYIFNAIENQTSFLTLTNNAAEALQLMMKIITGMSIFIAFVLGFLIVYASRFLMKRRNREFALYMIMGMKKTTIAGILGIESLGIGLLSLVVGLALGVLLSQLMSTFVAQLFEADLTRFVFTFSVYAFLKTILYFGIIMVVVLIFNLILVGKAKLIELLQSGSRGEKEKIKKPVFCVLLFVLGAGCLAFTYWLVTARVSFFTDEVNILIPIFLGLLGTFLVFWSLSSILLRFLSRVKKGYYKGLNSFTFRQLSGRINTMVASLTVICAMLFFTIAILSAAFSLRSSLNKSFRELTPVDVEITKTVGSGDDRREMYLEDYANELSEEELFELLAMDPEDVYTKAGFDLKIIFKDMVKVSYYFQNVDYGDTDGKTYTVTRPVMTQEDYNKVAWLFGKESVALKAGEYMIICNDRASIPMWNEMLSDNTQITVFGNELSPAAYNVQDGFIHLASKYEETGLFIVPSEIVDSSVESKSMILGNYKARDDAERAELEKKLRAVTEKIQTEEAGAFLSLNTKMDIRSAAVSLSAMITFLGLYLGFVFLISSAAILALKALSDSIDSKGRYQILRQIGAEEKEITASLRKQQGILFLLPLLLAILHSVFGIRFTTLVFQLIGVRHTAEALFLTAVVIVIIYAGYFLVTFFSSRRIIKDDGMLN